MKKLTLYLILSFTVLSCENKANKIGENKNNRIHKSKTTDSNVDSENFMMSFCSFAKIVDKDGFVNVREKGNINSKIIGKIKSGDVVFVFEDLETEWLNIDYRDGNDRKCNGYIHRSRIKYLNTLENIPSAIENENGVNFILRDIVVEIKTEKFNREQNKKYFSKDEQGFDNYKGKFMLGTEGHINEAKTFYKSITARIGNYTIHIPENEIEDLFNANNNYAECYFDQIDNSLYIHLSNSDGATSYVTLFKIQNHKYNGRQVEIPF